MDAAANIAAKAKGVVKLGKARMRILAAFAVAPLCAPAIVTSLFLATASPWSDIGAIVSVTLAYLAMLVLGVPAFYFLEARKLTSFWVALTAGFFIGAATYLIFEVVIGLAFDMDLAHALSVTSALTSPGSGDLFLLGLAGVSGTAAALVFWLIARPGSDNARSAG